MTVICALLMVVVYFVATHYGAPAGVTQGVLLVGVTAIAIYIRRAMIEMWDED